MGKSKGLYKAEFPRGSKVRIASRSSLEKFLRNWKLHNNKLEPDQLDYADRDAEVESVGFYHGGDELYRLKGIPGMRAIVCSSRTCQDPQCTFLVVEDRDSILYD